MHVKWFFVMFGLGFTFIMIMAILFMGNYLSQKGDVRFDNSTTVHQFLFDNITQLKKALDPILEQIPNATQSKIDQNLHYNQTSNIINTVTGVDKLLSAYSNGTERIEREEQDHELLISINKTLSEFVKENNSSNTENETISPIPNPVINNVTEREDRGLPLLR